MKNKLIARPRDIQTSVKSSDWHKRLRDAARPYVPTENGKQGVSANEMFVISAGMYATQILKELGMYDPIKKAYEDMYGKVEEYDSTKLNTGGEDEPNLFPDEMYEES